MGIGSPTGVAVDASGNVYISYPYFAGGTVIQVPWTTANGYGTPANVATGLGSPFGLATDGGGNVYIAVSNTGSVVEASPAGSGKWTISTPISGLSAPKGVAVDGSGNLYVADSAGQVVVEYPWTGSNDGDRQFLRREGRRRIDRRAGFRHDDFRHFEVRQQFYQFRRKLVGLARRGAVADRNQIDAMVITANFPRVASAASHCRCGSCG